MYCKVQSLVAELRERAASDISLSLCSDLVIVLADLQTTSNYAVKYQVEDWNVKSATPRRPRREARTSTATSATDKRYLLWAARLALSLPDLGQGAHDTKELLLGLTSEVFRPEGGKTLSQGTLDPDHDNQLQSGQHSEDNESDNNLKLLG